MSDELLSWGPKSAYLVPIPFVEKVPVWGYQWGYFTIESKNMHLIQCNNLNFRIPPPLPRTVVPSAAQLPGEIGQARRRPFPCLFVMGIGRGGAAVFFGAVDIGGQQPAGTRRRQIAVVGGDEA